MYTNKQRIYRKQCSNEKKLIVTNGCDNLSAKHAIYILSDLVCEYKLNLFLSLNQI